VQALREASFPLPIEVVVRGHTHQAYDCVLAGRLVTSAASYGRLLTKIDLTIDPSAHRVIAMHARNVPITRDLPHDAEVAGIVQAYADKAGSIASCGKAKGELILGSWEQQGGGRSLTFNKNGGLVESNMGTSSGWRYDRLWQASWST
jgi:hypothetical protein